MLIILWLFLLPHAWKYTFKSKELINFIFFPYVLHLFLEPKFYFLCCCWSFWLGNILTILTIQPEVFDFVPLSCVNADFKNIIKLSVSLLCNYKLIIVIYKKKIRGEEWIFIYINPAAIILLNQCLQYAIHDLLYKRLDVEFSVNDSRRHSHCWLLAVCADGELCLTVC